MPLLAVVWEVCSMAWFRSNYGWMMALSLSQSRYSYAERFNRTYRDEILSMYVLKR